MEIYHYQSDSNIAKVEFHQDAKDVWIARIFPQAGADATKLAALTAELNDRKDGIVAVPNSDKHVHSLYASGFKTPQHLLSHLQEMGCCGKTKPRLEKLDQDKMTQIQWIRDASLKLSGVFYMLSDVAIFGAGVTAKPPRIGESIAGLAYIGGGWMLTKYGRKDAHTHLKDLSISLGNFFKQEGIDIPKDSPIMGANNERSHTIIEGLEKFMYTYPSQIFNTIVAYAGANIMASGIKAQKPRVTTAGVLVLGGALAGLLIPEKDSKQVLDRPEDEKKSKGIFQRAYEWAQEKPLRLPGMLWFANNISYLANAIKEHRANPGEVSYKYGYAYVATAMIANALMFISTKQEAKRFDIDSDSMQALMAVAASVINQQPPEKRERIIQQVAGHLSSQRGIPQSSDQLANAIREEVDELSKNPFMPHCGKGEESIPLPEYKPAKKFTSKENKPAADWSAAVNATEDSSKFVSTGR